jgi:hypothetical protein
MDKRLLELRKKKAAQKKLEHKQLLDASTSIKEAVLSLHEKLNPAEPFDESRILEQIEQLKNNLTFKDEIKSLEQSLTNLYKQPLKLDNFTKLLEKVGAINNKDVVKAINDLGKKIEDNSVSQSPEDFAPVRRVIKVGSKLVFDDQITPMRSSGGGGGGGGSSIPQFLIDGDALRVTGDIEVDTAGLATDTKQDEQTDKLKSIAGFNVPEHDDIELSYTEGDLTGVVYKMGGSTVGELQLSYTEGNLTRVQRLS